MSSTVAGQDTSAPHSSIHHSLGVSNITLGVCGQTDRCVSTQIGPQPLFGGLGKTSWKGDDCAVLKGCKSLPEDKGRAFQVMRAGGAQAKWGWGVVPHVVDSEASGGAVLRGGSASPRVPGHPEEFREQSGFFLHRNFILIPFTSP